MKSILVLLALVLPAFASAETDKKSMTDEHMKEWMKAATPGEEHKTLATLAGSWKYTSKWWTEPTAKPMESAGTSTNKMVMGGRYLQSEAKGKNMGQPFTGMGLTGFDNVKKNFDTMWIDNMGTGMAKGTGTWDASTKTMTETGSFSDPTEKTMTRNYKGMMKIADKNHYTYEMWATGPDGKEFKMMEMAYKRN